MLPSATSASLVAGVAFLWAAPREASAAVEFAGILVTSEKTLFRLRDEAAGAAAAWVQIGQTFAGHEILHFDAQQEALTLRQAGATSVVRLKDAKVQPDASIAIDVGVSLGGGEKPEVSRATLVFGQENSFPLREGLLCLITPTRLPDGTIRYRLAFERPDADGHPERLSALSIIQRAGDPISLQLTPKKNSAAPLGLTLTAPRNPPPPVSPPPEREKPPRARTLQKTKP